MFWLFSIRLLVVLLSTNLQAQCEVFSVRSHASCMTGTPDDLLLQEHQRLGLLEADNERASASENRVILAPIEIDTWFHIVSSEAAAKSISDEMVLAQVSYLLKCK